MANAVKVINMYTSIVSEYQNPQLKVPVPQSIDLELKGSGINRDSNIKIPENPYKQPARRPFIE